MDNILGLAAAGILGDSWLTHIIVLLAEFFFGFLVVGGDLGY